MNGEDKVAIEAGGQIYEFKKSQFSAILLLSRVATGEYAESMTRELCIKYEEWYGMSPDEKLESKIRKDVQKTFEAIKKRRLNRSMAYARLITTFHFGTDCYNDRELREKIRLAGEQNGS